MTTKRELIEGIQNRLAGGDVPADIQGKYPKQVIGQLIGKVYEDTAYQNKQRVRNMALPYTSTIITANSQYYLMLPVKPINGLSGIVSIRGNETGGVYPVAQGLEEATIMQTLLPNLKVFASNIVGNKLYFTDKPDATVSINIIPSFKDLSDDDNVCIEGMEVEIFNAVMQLMRDNVSQLEEVYNNRVPDTDKPTPPAK